MEIVVVINDEAKIKALERALAEYNARNPSLLGNQFIEKIVNAQLDNLVQRYLTTSITKLEFLDRLTPEERVGILTAAQTNMAVADCLNTFNAAKETVSLTSERTISYVHGLEAAGLIGPGRAAEILAL